MKASYNWIRALVPGLTAPAREVAEKLTRAGLEVEAIIELGEGTRDVVVAEVRKVEDHPTRPKLHLVTVDKGGGEQRVVCGANNVPDPGGLVCFAPVGTHLPAKGMTLTPREIGGIVSEGMLCSESELGLIQGGKDDDPGILVLAKGTGKAGAPLREAVPAVHDFIFEIGLTPNRPDGLGHVGLAREVAALYGLDFGVPSPDSPLRVATSGIRGMVEINVSDTERCPHYGAAMVLDITVGPSPLWLKYRLESLGYRSISNVVDVTNLVMLEFGHPMHAFDFDLVRGNKIGVRRAKNGEVMKTLDGVERKLTEDDLVITDGEGPVALAGIMGGENSEIRATTKRVLLECAYFTPRGVRRSARRHGIHTESSHRFERGVDPADIPDVLAHAASLLTTLASGTAVPGTIIAGIEPAPPKTIELRADRMRSLLGVDWPLSGGTAILKRLGCGVKVETADAATIIAPTFRPDLTLEADLIEEIMRVRGLDSVPTILPAIKPQEPRPDRDLSARVRRAAIDVGLSEAVVLGFVSPKELEQIGAPPAAVVLQNPLTEERSVMRTSLLPGLLEALRRARRHGVKDVKLFAVGQRFLKASPNAGALPDEVPSFAAVLAGDRATRLAKPEELDVYDAKGIALEIVERATRRAATVVAQAPSSRASHLHPRGAGNVVIDGHVVGHLGPLHPDVADAMDLGGGALVIELDLRALSSIGLATPKFKPIPTLPAATRDIAVVVSDDVNAGSVGDAIREAASALCESVELFDLFRGGAVPDGHRSLAFHVVYRDPKAATDPDHAKTLTDEEVDKMHKAVVDSVGKKFGAVLRA